MEKTIKNVKAQQLPSNVLPEGSELGAVIELTWERR
jgi:hypothetical protein